MFGVRTFSPRSRDMILQGSSKLVGLFFAPLHSLWRSRALAGRRSKNEDPGGGVRGLTIAEPVRVRGLGVPARRWITRHRKP
jgi:hypothetical protein